ncbi:MAG: HEAT repeat domain-containing protein [Elusimicrobia bacterium]|nr:HEAT repeat domain-containing protein [Elusimicrobiota bacterium]
MRPAPLAISIFFAAAIAAAQPADEGQRAAAALRAMEVIAAQQKGADPLGQRSVDKTLEGFGAKFRAMGARAIEPLSAYLGDKRRPRKVRLYAAAFLGLIGDPGALDALKDRLADPEEDAGLRAAALQAAGSLRLSVPAKRALAEKAAFDPSAPALLLREALGVLAETGSDETAKLEKLAKRYGPDPRGTREIFASHALSALLSSRRPAEASLVSLLRYFKKGTRLRAETLSTLRARKPKAKDISREDTDFIATLLFDEKGRTALEAARLLGELADSRAAASLIRALKAEGPALLAEAAEALVKLGDPSAQAPLSKLSEGLIRDPRFVPRGSLDPRPYAVRIQKAAVFFAKAGAKRKPLAGPLPQAPSPGADSAPQTLWEEVPDIAEAPPFRGTPTPERIQAASKPDEISSDDEEAVAAERPPALPAQIPAPAPSAPSFRYEGWPVSEKPHPVWSGRRDSLALRAKPDDLAPGAAVRLTKGLPLPVASSLVITLEPGLMRARSANSVEFRDLGADRALKRLDYEGPLIRKVLELRQGETFEILAYRPDGACFLRRGGRLYLGECITQEADEVFKVVAEPKTRWWIRTEAAGATGWFSAEEEGIDFGR